MSVKIEAVRRPSDELLRAFARLLPQLSSSAEPLDHDMLLAVLASPDTTLLVARLTGAIVGTLTLSVSPLPSGIRAHIDDVVVDTAARGHGVGSALLDEALLLARAAGARSVDLTSRPSREAANQLYLRAGFRLRESNVYRFALAE
jgi:ribosomal protein S18 acetylase RimI-like enzyme